MYMVTKLGRMVTHYEQLPPITSKSVLVGQKSVITEHRVRVRGNKGIIFIGR